MNNSQATAQNEPTEKQIEFRNRKRAKGLARAKAIFNLMKVHNLNLPALEEYVNKKNDQGLPFYPDITPEILPDPTSTISRARLQQILARSEEYKAQSSWKSTREKAHESHLIVQD